MPKVSLLFEVKAETLDEARPRIEAALDLRTALHSSDYLGGAYDRAKTGHGEELRLMTNFIDDDDEHIERDFPESPLLLYVFGTEREDHFVSALAPVGRLLRRTPWKTS